jgi:(p)ppGpp synthase/HD superfamily hydrolase
LGLDWLDYNDLFSSPIRRVNVRLSPQFEKALIYATRNHGGKLRKKSRIPYIAHVLGVAAIAMEYGANETEAIGALLHDAVEDCGGARRLRDIERKFGRKIARIVEGCTDTDQIPKPPWRERKENYIAHLKRVSASTRLVSAADKLHNARAILHNLRQEGDPLWSRFNGGKEGALWYYRSLVSAFREHGSNELIEELDRVVTEIEEFASENRSVERRRHACGGG